LNHEKYIARCIQLAKNGLGTTGSNPMVGSVLVVNDTIIGEGWHYKAGQPHAEVNAIGSVKDTSLLKKATIYVSLEPCSHFGKTPPCSDLIIRSGIKKVVIGTVDPFAKVSGAGIKKLKAAGCEVIVGVLVKECHELNKRFFTYHTKKRPFISLKWAQTADGFMAPEYLPQSSRQPVWITDKFTKQWVHKQRAVSDAILVGTSTVIKDNPSLTTRLWKGTHPLRVVLDLHHKIPANSTLFTDGLPTLVITSKLLKNTESVTCEVLTDTENLARQLVAILYKHQIQSLIVEGGKQLLETFIEANLWDEANVFVGDHVFFNKGLKAPIISQSGIVSKTQTNNTKIQFTND